MQRQVAETVDFVGLALVDGVLPVYLEEAFESCGYLVYVVYIERDDPHAEDVGNIKDVAVLVTFQGQFALEGRFGFDAMLY